MVDCLAMLAGLYDFAMSQKRLVEVVLLIVMPLGWGLGVEYFFRFLRGRRLTGPKKQEPRG